MPSIHLVTVFPAAPGGGNPAPIVLDAATLTDAQMQSIAREHGHESAFLIPPPPGADLALRFWVPAHEMEMCGHATVGTVWLLNHLNRLPTPTPTIWTKSGLVQARAGDPTEISQPEGRVTPIPDPTEILQILGLTPADLADAPIQNAATSRIKTLIPLRDPATLDALTPDYGRIESLCERLGSTGLYPYASSGPSQWDARQFPKSSGYPEDAATGIAAAALLYGLRAIAPLPPGAIRIRQGRAMGRPSEITLRLRTDAPGCWLGGPVHLA